MNQEQITICFLDGKEAKFTKEYTAIMDELSQGTNQKWILFDYYSSDIQIKETTNLQYYSKLRAINVEQIVNYFKEYTQIEIIKKKYPIVKSQLKEYQKKAEQYEKYEKVQVSQAVQGFDLQQKCGEQEKQIEILNEKIKVLEEQIQKDKKLQKEMTEENERKIKLLIVGENDNLKLISKNNEQSNRLQSLQQENQQLSQEMQVLQENFTQKSQQLEQQTIILDQYIQQSSQQINELTNQIPNQQSQQLQTPQTDEQNQEFAQQSQGNQIKFLEDFVKKKCDDEERLKPVTINGSESIIFHKVEVFQITLINDQPTEQMLYFIRQDRFFEKQLPEIYYEDFSKQNQLKICVDDKTLDIEKVGVGKFHKSKYEALNVIFNLLLVERYVKLFAEYFKKEKQLEIWNLKIPRQFLIKDRLGNYYTYQECFKNTKDFTPFKNSQSVDQYISTFFSFFYYSTNQNFALANCKLTEQMNDQQKEIVISSIVIHSKFKKGYSQLDEGMDKITEFENMQLQGPPGITQIYWSDELKKKAQKTWNDQFN